MFFVTCVSDLKFFLFEIVLNSCIYPLMTKMLITCFVVDGMYISCVL